MSGYESMDTTYCRIPKGTTVLVTGGTGFTGSVLLRKLVAAGVKVKVIARHSSNIEPFEGFKIEWIRGDVFDPEIVKKAVEGVQYIFHVAAAFREAKVADDFYWNVHVKSTQLLAEEALKQKRFRRFIHISTIGVHSHIEEPPADEEYRFAPDDLYQKTKAEAELWIRDFAPKHNLPFVVVRPAGIYGPGDKRLLKLFKAAKKGWFPILNNHNTLYHLIHVDDLTDFFLLCATHKDAEGDYFICGNTINTSIREILSVIAEEYKTKVRFISISSGLLFLAADICETLCKPFGVEPPLYRRRVAFFTKDRSFNTSKMQEKLGFVPKYNNKQGIRATAEWYEMNHWV